MSTHVDPALRSLIVLATLGVETPVTLHVPGAAVSGRLISARRYHELAAEFTERTAKGVPPDFLEMLMRRYTEEAQELRELEERNSAHSRREAEELVSEADQDEIDRIDEALYGYAHLTDARLILDLASLPRTSGGVETLGLWRGDARRVGGFMLGTPARG